MLLGDGIYGFLISPVGLNGERARKLGLMGEGLDILRRAKSLMVSWTKKKCTCIYNG